MAGLIVYLNFVILHLYLYISLATVGDEAGNNMILLGGIFNVNSDLLGMLDFDSLVFVLYLIRCIRDTVRIYPIYTCVASVRVYLPNNQVKIIVICECPSCFFLSHYIRYLFNTL